MLLHPDDVVDPLLDELFDVALEAARGAAGILSRGFGEARVSVSTKSSPTDMVSEVDRAAEAHVGAILAARRPADGLLGEEGASRDGTTGVRWVVDPLDGTTNYLFGIPAFAVSIAAEVAGSPVVGVVIDPCRQETWTARRGAGAWCNDQRVTVTDGRSTLSTALVATGFGYQQQRRAWQARLLPRILPAVRDIRRNGAASLDLCWVAGGRFDAYYEWGLSPWDLSAGRLLCTEAGAKVAILPGHTVLAATPALAEPLTRLLVDAGINEPLD